MLNKIELFKTRIFHENKTYLLVSDAAKALGYVSTADFMDKYSELIVFIEQMPKLISETDFNSATLGVTAYGGHTNLTETGWAKIGASYAEVSLGSGSLTIKNTSAPTNWYQAGVAYRSTNIVKKTKYNLSLNLACDSDNGLGLTVRVYKYDTTQSKYVTLVDKYPTARTDIWTYDIDLSAAPDNYPIIIGIGIKTTSEINTTYTSTNLKFVEVQE